MYNKATIDTRREIMTLLFDPKELENYSGLQTFIDETELEELDENELQTLFDCLQLQSHYGLELAELGKKTLPIASIIASLGLVPQLNALIKIQPVNLLETFKAAARSGQLEIINELLNNHYTTLNENQTKYEKMVTAAIASASKYGHTNVVDRLLSLVAQGTIVNIPKDGNCFFHAVLYEAQKQNIGWHFFDHRALRKETINYMKNNSSSFKPFFTDEETIEQYMEKMSFSGNHYLPGEWASGPVIEAFAKGFGVHLEIIDIDKTISKISIGDDNRPNHIKLLRHNHHYSAIDTKNYALQESISNSYTPAYQINSDSAMINNQIARRIQENMERIQSAIEIHKKERVIQKTLNLASLVGSVIPNIADIETNPNQKEIDQIIIELNLKIKECLDINPDAAKAAALLTKLPLFTDDGSIFCIDQNINMIRSFYLQLRACHEMSSYLFAEECVNLFLQTIIAFCKASYEIVPQERKVFEDKGKMLFFQAEEVQNKVLTHATASMELGDLYFGRPG